MTASSLHMWVSCCTLVDLFRLTLWVFPWLCGSFVDFVGLSLYFRESLESFTFHICASVHVCICLVFSDVYQSLLTYWHAVESGVDHDAREMCELNESRLRYMRAMTHSYAWHDSSTCVTYAQHTLRRAPKKMQDTPKNESWNAYEWVMSHVRMIPGTDLKESCRTYNCVTTQIRMSHVTRMNESWHTSEWMIHVVRII